MTDKELLELAAKAAGIEWSKACGAYINTPWEHWNPLTDDGDALRLAIKLKLQIQPWDDRVDSGKFPFGGQCEMYGDDPYAATRRAIVRAAAEIGRTM